MVIYLSPGETLYRAVTDAPTGLVGQVGVRIETADDTDTVVIPRTSAGIVEFATGAYRKAIVWPEGPGSYVDIWDFPGDIEVVGDDEIRITDTGQPAGNPYFTDDEAAAYLNDDDVTTEDIQEGRAIVESRFERICGVAFVPREATETLNGLTGTTLRLRWPKVRAILSITNDGAAVDLADIRVNALGAYRAAGWLEGISNLTVTYSHGFDAPPPEVKRAALRYLREVVSKSPADDRAIRVDMEDGSYQRAVAGSNRPTGIPDVDVVLESYSYTNRIPRLV